VAPITNKVILFHTFSVAFRVPVTGETVKCLKQDDDADDRQAQLAVKKNWKFD